MRCVTFESAADVPGLKELGEALGVPDDGGARRFQGMLEAQWVEDPEDPPTWRTIGPIGRYSIVLAAEQARFLLGDPRITTLRVVRFETGDLSL